MASLDAFLPLIYGRLPGCPDIILRDGVRDACIEFCQRTRLLTETKPVTVTATVPRGSFTPTTGLVAWEALALYRDTTLLVPANREAFIELGYDVDSGVPELYYLEGDGSLALGPIPNANETLSLTFSARPSDSATTVPEVLFTHYRLVIAAGARAWTRRNHGDWANFQAEAEDRQIFEHAIHNQNIRRVRGGANTAPRVRSHPF